MLLEREGISYWAEPSGIEELTEGFDPSELVIANACAKAQAVAGRRPDADAILGVDTLVALGTRVFGQPANAADAKATLMALSGKTHQVHSGVCLIINGSQRTGIETTAVRFQSLSDQQIGQYVATDEWRGRAGGYAIQSGGQRLVESVIGDLDNVIGLPLDLLLKLAPELAIN